uniref:Uncharacterized protein n=1 Tax=Methylophaga nitratireducenticrescens TaxID=754476 RepID=I1XKD6_METNJ
MVLNSLPVFQGDCSAVISAGMKRKMAVSKENCHIPKTINYITN